MTEDEARRDEAGYVRIRIYRRNGKILHTCERYAHTDWVVNSPSAVPLRRRAPYNRAAADDPRNDPAFVPRPPPAGSENLNHVLTSRGIWEVDHRNAGVLQDGIYTLGDGIPPIREAKLHRLLDGLDAAGIRSMDSDQLIRIITAGSPLI